MSRGEFKKYIKCIGFDDFYRYKKYRINLYIDHYHFYNGSEWSEDISFNDLTPFENNMIKELRTIKLKELLG